MFIFFLYTLVGLIVVLEIVALIVVLQIMTLRNKFVKRFGYKCWFLVGGVVLVLIGKLF